MISSIFKDLQARFGSLIAQIIIAVVVGILLVALGKMAWNKLWGNDTDALKDRIHNQTQVIEEITDINRSNIEAARKDRAAQEEAKNDLVTHVQNQNDRERQFDAIEEDLREKQEASQNKLVIIKAAIPLVKAAIKDQKNKEAKKKAEQPTSEKAVKSVPGAVASTLVIPAELTQDDFEQEIVRAQQRATIVQDSVWKAYELAKTASQS